MHTDCLHRCCADQKAAVQLAVLHQQMNQTLSSGIAIDVFLLKVLLELFSVHQADLLPLGAMAGIASKDDSNNCHHVTQES